MTVASILSPWILQKYWKVPDVAKVWEKDAPPIRTPESQRPSGFPTAPEVTVCPLSPPLVHLTVSPTEMVTVVGSKNLSPIDELYVLDSVVVGGGVVVVVGMVVVGGGVVVVVGMVVVGDVALSGDSVPAVDDVVVTPVVSVVEDSAVVRESLLVVVGAPVVELEPPVRAVGGTVEWTLLSCVTSSEAQAKRINAKTPRSPRCLPTLFFLLTPNNRYMTQRTEIAAARAWSRGPVSRCPQIPHG